MPDLAQELARWIAPQAHAGRTLLVGINGAQGSGKSTLARQLCARLAEGPGLRAVVLALDDLYLRRDERLALAAREHPLLRTRGVPGTHDVGLGLRLIGQLKSLPAGARLALPHFVKARDDRDAPSRWPQVQGPVDVLLFEGWCVGTPPQAAEALQAPVNALEAHEDADGRWRGFVNAQLAQDYAALFAPLDRLVFLQAPDFETVFGWRRQQEADNAREAAAEGAPAMNAAALRRFIGHYERLTRHALAVLPGRADVVVALRADRSVASLRFRKQPAA